MSSGAGFTGTVSDLIGKVGSFFGEGSVAQQFLIWGVLQQVAGAALGPAVNDIAQAINSADPNLTLTPEQLAVGAVRQIIDPGNAQSEAAKSGIGSGRFDQLQALASQPASLDLIIAAYQRSQAATGGATDAPVDIDGALADLGIATKYWDLIKALAIQIPTAQQVLNAWLVGQITEDEARPRLLQAGMDPTWIDTAYAANGQAPTPNEMLEMLNRGLIPYDSGDPGIPGYVQGFLQGPWRNEWLPVFTSLRYYVPPPRTVTALLKEGSITEAQAMQYLADAGLDETLTGIYIKAASHTTTVAQRELTQAQIIDLYESKLIDESQATADLVALKFSPSDAQLLLALADKKQAAAATKSAVTRLQNLYLAGTNSLTVTTAALHGLGLTDANVSNLIATWNLEQSSKVKTLTEGQVIAAWFYGGFGENDTPAAIQAAVTRLQADGYSQADALLLLTARYHSPIALTGPVTT